MRLHSDWAYLEQEFGCSVQQQFLMAVRSLDNPRAVTPFLLESGGRRFGLFLHVERGNVESARLPPDIEPVYYRPYFTFEPPGDPPSVHDGLSDAIAVYMDRLRSFAAGAMPGIRTARTLTNFHTGARTIFPSNPAPYPLDRACNVLKVDAGCLLFDAEGYLLGCSDIARTLALSEAGQDLYRRFREGVCRALIPAAAAGRCGQELHEIGVASVWDKRRELGTNPLFVDLERPDLSYDRDVGHLLGKNNLAHLRFAHGDRETLQEGMIACCEYQWPIAGHAIAYEDTCLVTPQGGLNLTCDEQDDIG